MAYPYLQQSFFNKNRLTGGNTVLTQSVRSQVATGFDEDKHSLPPYPAGQFVSITHQQSNENLSLNNLVSSLNIRMVNVCKAAIIR